MLMFFWMAEFLCLVNREAEGEVFFGYSVKAFPIGFS